MPVIMDYWPVNDNNNKRTRTDSTGSFAIQETDFHVASLLAMTW